MICLVCNKRRAPTQTGLCKLCDHGFHPPDEPVRLIPMRMSDIFKNGHIKVHFVGIEEGTEFEMISTPLTFRKIDRS